MKTTNAMQLKALIKNKAKEIGVAPQLVLQNYMLERLLERMSRSEHADKFIIKGGFLLSSVVGPLPGQRWIWTQPLKESL